MNIEKIMYYSMSVDHKKMCPNVGQSIDFWDILSRKCCAFLCKVGHLVTLCKDILLFRGEVETIVKCFGVVKHVFRCFLFSIDHFPQSHSILVPL